MLCTMGLRLYSLHYGGATVWTFQLNQNWLNEAIHGTIRGQITQQLNFNLW
jgi:hypothetical protein